MFVASVFSSQSRTVHRAFSRLAAANLFATGEALEFFDGEIDRIEIRSVPADTEEKAIAGASSQRGELIKIFDQPEPMDDEDRRRRESARKLLGDFGL